MVAIIIYKRADSRFFLFFLFVFFFLLGLWRYSVLLSQNSPDEIRYYNGQTVQIRGIVAEEPDTRETSQKLTIEADYNRARGKVLITTDLYPSYDYGDEVEAVCGLKAPESFNGFAYDRYLARFGVYSVCYYPEITLIGKGRGSKIYQYIFKFKNRLRSVIDRGVLSPESNLSRAIVLGDKRAVSDNWRDTFSKSGLSHIAAISGMHISILSAMVMSFLLFLGLKRKQAFYLALGFLIFYIIIIGAPASAVRAGIMGFLVLLSFQVGRQNKIINALFLAGALMLLSNPLLLRDDIGFELSFLAVLGIVYFYPIISAWLKGRRFARFIPFAVIDIFSITVSAQLLTLPIIAYNFNQVSLIAPAANLAVIPVIPFILAGVLLGVFLSFLWPGAAAVFFLPALVLLKYVLFISSRAASLPLAFLTIGFLSCGWVIFYYSAVFCFCLKYGKIK